MKKTLLAALAALIRFRPGGQGHLDAIAAQLADDAAPRFGGEVIFFDSKDRCDVKAVFGVSKQKPGKYVATVSHEDDDWYEVFGTSSYIKTSSCLSLALGEEAYLTIATSGFGRLRFKDGNDCMVEAVYTKLRL